MRIDLYVDIPAHWVSLKAEEEEVASFDIRTVCDEVAVGLIYNVVEFYNADSIQTWMRKEPNHPFVPTAKRNLTTGFSLGVV